MAKCSVCGKSSELISKGLNLCLNCIREKSKEVSPYIEEAHAESRKAFGLPAKPPKDPEGLLCNICVNECRIPDGERGFCGLRRNEDGKLVGVSPTQGNLSWYHDPLPTNCVADWVCPGGCGAGFPEYAYKKGPEYGYKNLAVFFQACSFNCLFCQNWHFREEVLNPQRREVQELVNSVDETTSCICYFGGDPTPQLPFAIKASKLTIEKSPHPPFTKGGIEDGGMEGFSSKNNRRILRICWETNGTMNKALLKEMIKLSLESGGCIKFDLKAWNENLNIALTGITNKRTLENFSIVAERIKERPEPPLLIASTLLTPGYIDEEEIKNIANFIASLDKNIPYALLGFYPHFYMSDLPLTSQIFAYRCLRVAEDAGLKRVRLGNMHLLG
jgi:pyruvate formate lyase activating enzyme